MHALHELRYDLVTRLIASVQSVQHASSEGQMYAIILSDHRANITVVGGTFFVNSFSSQDIV